MTDIVQTENSIDDGVFEYNGNSFMTDARGALVPVELIKPQHKLEDETVRKVMAFARDLSNQIERFRSHTKLDLGVFNALLEQEYKVSKGGKKGNCTYQTYDGLMKIQVQISEFTSFGPQLQIAKQLVDECLNEWSADSVPEIRALVTRAFNTDKEGNINQSDIFMLLRLDSEDDRWMRAMDAIREAMHVTSSKEYIRFYERKTIADKWQAITIDLAKA